MEKYVCCEEKTKEENVFRVFDHKGLKGSTVQKWWNY